MAEPTRERWIVGIPEADLAVLAERMGITVQQILDGVEEQDMDVAAAWLRPRSSRPRTSFDP